MQITRQRIVDHLRNHNQATVEELAQAVGLTHMAIRHHLNVLQRDGLLEIAKTRRAKKPGRPVQVYVLTNRAERLYPQDYFQLSELLLEEMISQIGPNGVAQVFNNIAERLLEIAPQPKEGQSFEERLDEVVYFLQQKGFAAQWGVEEGRYVIYHLACPYRRLAAQHHEICLLDEVLISSMLEAKLDRVSCIAHDDRKCAYCLDVPVSPESAVTIEQSEVALLT